jgi:hypothetical protein
VIEVLNEVLMWIDLVLILAGLMPLLLTSRIRMRNVPPAVD